MAILRGGKRIGGYDVRVGIPRDKSLENVENDDRFRQKPGGNPETVMGRFLSSVGEAEGFARQARYYVDFGLPRGISSPISTRATKPPSLGFNEQNNDQQFSNDIEEIVGFTSQSDFFLQTDNIRRVQSFCRSINMPGRTIEQVAVQHNGPPRNIAIDHTYGQITATFYSDKFLRERQFFEMWQKCAINLESHNLNFYDNYVADMNIYQLGSFISKNERDSKTYACHIYDAFPTTIGDIQYSYDNNNVVEFTVTFSYRYWVNFYLDKKGNIDVGTSQLDDYTIKRADKGLLGKLPPELRRAGKQVLDQISRSVPTGRITNGRVFPPFL
jgi:hypothetical protein